MDAASVTLSDLESGSGVTLSASELDSSEVVVVDDIGVAHLFGPPIEAVVVDDGTPPFAKRVTVKCECRCGQVLGRYTGGLRLTATTRGGVPGMRLRPDGVFVTNCWRHIGKGPSSGWQTCRVPPKEWPYQLLATELRTTWDEGRRRFVLT
jgi:hypothetical protein